MIVGREIDVAVIGAGQAGLSSAYFLHRAGMRANREIVVFDAAATAGGAWQYRWPTLTFETVHGIHRLPGMDIPPQDPATQVSAAVPQYFASYESQYDLQVHRPVKVKAVHNDTDHRLRIETDTDGQYFARALINSTGTWDKPFWPHYPGQATFLGRQLHTADYLGKDSFKGQRVVVVGAGASAIQLLMEIAKVAAKTIWVTRNPPQFTQREFDTRWGREVEEKVKKQVEQGLPPQSVVTATGYPLTPAVSAAIQSGILHRLPMFSTITKHGVAWDDGSYAAADTIVWATGFRASLDHLAPLRLRGPGGGIVMDGTQVASDPRIQLVGYGPSASTIGANRAGRTAVNRVRQYLATVPVAVN